MPRSTFLESADLPEPTLPRRLMRLQLRRPADATLSAQGGGDPRVFTPSEEGSGIFGRWILDDAGLPAYEYELDQYLDPRAAYPNTENLDRRDHWHQVGNQRVTALASNDGTVQVYMGDRGGVFLNRFEAYGAPGTTLLVLLARLALRIINFIVRLINPPKTPTGASAQSAAEVQAAEGVYTPRTAPSLAALDMLAGNTSSGDTPGAQAVEKSFAQRYQEAGQIKRNAAAIRHAYAGGFGYIDDGTEVWSTAYRYRPNGAETRRIFGMGYAEYETTHRQTRVRRRVYAPYGDVPALVSNVEITNLSAQPVTLRHTEYWDVNVQQLKVEWLRGYNFAAASDENRRALNKDFACSVNYQREKGLIVCQQRVNQPPPSGFRLPEEACDVDWTPSQIFLADLSGTPDAHYFQKAAFFGTGGAKSPDGLRSGQASNDAQASAGSDPMPFCFALRRDITLQPGETRTLRYAYGAVKAGEALNFLDAYRLPENSGETVPQTPDPRPKWRDALAYFYTGEDPVLQREMAWHAYNLLSSVVCSDFHQVHLVPQGSAYLYLHGADGAPRDQALFSLPMTYLDPALARDLLGLVMRLRNRETGQITYSFVGHGAVSDALGFHNQPSDLDLFLLLGLTEYLAATGDMAFLNEKLPFYPPSQSDSTPRVPVLDHIRAALKHIFEGTGIGEHGLIKVGSGDWSDSIVLETALRDGIIGGVAYKKSKANGESVPNTQMALYVLPLLAAQVQAVAPDIAEYINKWIPGLREAAARQWNSKGWYNRAVLRDGSDKPVVIDRLDLEAQPWALISHLAQTNGIDNVLVERVEADLDRPSKVGASLLPGGMVWPAVSQLLTWAYAHTGRPDLAWRSLNRNTFAAHSTEYPAQWLGTWSGPDGVHGTSATAPNLPGGAWASELTPMTDFPVMNGNPDAMALLALLRVCGIEPAPGGDGLTIRPCLPRQRFTLDLPLLRLEVEPGRVSGVYKAATAGAIKLYIYLPGSDTPQVVPLAFQAGGVRSFAVSSLS